MSGYGIPETVTCKHCGKSRQRELRGEVGRREKTDCISCRSKAREARKRIGRGL